MNKKKYTSPCCVVHSLCEEVVLLAGTGNTPSQPSTPTLRVDMKVVRRLKMKEKSSKRIHIYLQEKLTFLWKNILYS